MFHLTTLSVVYIVGGRWTKCEYGAFIGGMIPTSGKLTYSEKYLYHCHFFHHESHTAVLVSNRSLRFLFSFTSFAICPIETSISFAGPRFAESIFVWIRKVLETSILTGICSYIHYLFLSILFFGLLFHRFLPLCTFSVWIYTDLPFSSVILISLIQ